MKDIEYINMKLNENNNSSKIDNVNSEKSWVYNNSFFKSVKCAAIGMINAYKTEPNFIRYLVIILIGIIVNILIKIDNIEWIIYILNIIGVFSSEMINTAIEKLCNLITTQYNESIKYIKDTAAAGVLLWGIAFFGFEGYLIISKLVEIL